MKNIKYMAGFLDADGSFGISSFKNTDGTYTIYPIVSAAQAVYQRKPIDLLGEEFGLETFSRTFPNKNWSDTVNIFLSGKKAMRLMEQVKNHLVLKRDIVEFILSLTQTRVPKEELSLLKKEIKALRKLPQSKIKPFPSRRWLAGYFDGDGCITSSLMKDGTLVTFITISCWIYDREGIELIQKNFGGSIQESKTELKYRLNLTKQNCNKILGYFSKHCINKKDQLYFVKDYLENSRHLKRRGATTESNKELKLKLSSMKRGRID